MAVDVAQTGQVRIQPPLNLGLFRGEVSPGEAGFLLAFEISQQVVAYGLPYRLAVGQFRQIARLRAFLHGIDQ